MNGVTCTYLSPSVNHIEMVVATASATATGASSVRYSSGSDQRRLRPAQKLTSYTKFAIHYPNCLSSTRVKGYFPIRALDPQRGGEEEEEEEVNSNVGNNGSGLISEVYPFAPFLFFD